jgi:glycosyltransferase involved in cell wall biosynthesis
VITLAEVGGAQSYVRDLLPAVAEEFEVTVSAHGEGPLRIAAADAGVRYVPLEHVRRPISPLHDLLGLLELARLFRRLRPDIVHLNSSKAGVLGRLAAAIADVPIRVFTVHGWAFKATHGLAARLYLLADRAVRPLTTMIVCVSETELRAGLAAGTCTPKHATVILNAVDVAGAPQRVGARHDGPVEIVSVGRLAEPKDFATLVRAVARLPREAVHVSVLGEGPLNSELEHLIAALGLTGTVRLLGEVSDVRERLARAEVFVLSSRSEGMPISVLEAMAASLPVVASAVGGVPEIVQDGLNGFLVPPGEDHELADRLRLLVESPSLRARLGAASRRRAEERHSLPQWREAHIALYRALVREAPARRPSR